MDIVDLFSGSGIVSRYFKKYSNHLITNDLDGYSYTLNECYLANKSDINITMLRYYSKLEDGLKELKPGFITELYAPSNDNNIKAGERVFYTTRNAMYIDTAVKIINSFPKYIRPFFLGPLLTEASIKNNTAGVFKGFYKDRDTGIGMFGGTGNNALSRIKSDIEIPFPVFSNFECKVTNYMEDANQLVKELDHVDLMYIDPPYNQHPYGSNYFMLNLINDYEKPLNISKVAGIPSDWHRSDYNHKQLALTSLKNLCNNCNSDYILISFNNEGFISREEMVDMLSTIGKVKIFRKKYNTYKASRNLKNRNLYTYEYLFLVKKSN